MLEGFTLFHTNKGWQLSIKQADVDGWSVRYIPEAQAKRILGEIDMSIGYVPPEPKHKKRVLVLE